ncbi:STAS domain-containing protein [Xanthomonas sp. XNM01]|uniref:STAS domain-containing protein n=1 Tax=Xanthomonas sp. XNM01 TaxID=2769289 RepID=UPI00177D2468|nr:STAS domain-containing protein [Xanthomonas sp. XNM01]MBD9370363.1 STAS domain-containing protein [Xanthomonas sp. XNM01]
MNRAEPASVTRAGERLRIAGALDRASATALWPALERQAAGAAVLDLTGVVRLDSAGLALLAELAARLRQQGPLRIDGDPDGLADLRAAYRLGDTLDYVANTP